MSSKCSILLTNNGLPCDQSKLEHPSKAVDQKTAIDVKNNQGWIFISASPIDQKSANGKDVGQHANGSTPPDERMDLVMLVSCVKRIVAGNSASFYPLEGRQWVVRRD